MILGILGVRIRASNGVHRAGENFQFCLILSVFLKYKSVTKMNLNLRIFIHEII